MDEEEAVKSWCRQPMRSIWRTWDLCQRLSPELFEAAKRFVFDFRDGHTKPISAELEPELYGLLEWLGEQSLRAAEKSRMPEEIGRLMHSHLRSGTFSFSPLHRLLKVELRYRGKDTCMIWDSPGAYGQIRSTYGFCAPQPRRASPTDDSVNAARPASSRVQNNALGRRDRPGASALSHNTHRARLHDCLRTHQHAQPRGPHGPAHTRITRAAILRDAGLVSSDLSRTARSAGADGSGENIILIHRRSSARETLMVPVSVNARPTARSSITDRPISLWPHQKPWHLRRFRSIRRFTGLAACIGRGSRPRRAPFGRP
jgi:hypothetical protein